jgi:hypothetical protein
MDWTGACSASPQECRLIGFELQLSAFELDGGLKLGPPLSQIPNAFNTLSSLGLRRVSLHLLDRLAEAFQINVVYFHGCYYLQFAELQIHHYRP